MFSQNFQCSIELLPKIEQTSIINFFKGQTLHSKLWLFLRRLKELLNCIKECERYIALPIHASESIGTKLYFEIVHG